ncbi:hypothetical protein [Methylorubrum sp. SB2]|uniref:Cap15 family cyclic dinucleotide receptor domain-containing protein n=1 Tax=Methylorubrum subtropicum TaxID=3138812 RepID=UPI00313D966C
MSKLSHEYSVIGGFNRAKVGHSIGVVSAIISSGVVTLFLLLVQIAKYFGYGERIPALILWPLGAATIYAGIYWYFEKHGWKISAVSSFLKVPNLDGKWHCKGRKLNPDGSVELEWTGVLTIVQSWDQIRLYLKTGDSGSDSISAALLHDASIGYKLMYTYKNQPRPDKPHLAPHTGYAELLFDPDLKSAEGDYFNGRGRYSFGTMELSRM